MKKFTFTLLMVFFTISSWSQTVDSVIIFSENFDGTTHQMLSTSNHVMAPGFDWNVIDSLHASGQNCIFSPLYIVPSLSSTITTPPLPYMGGATNYYLSFNQICKIHMLDDARIQVRYSTGSDTWTSWQGLSFSDTSACYLGEGQSIISGRFSQNCYDTWLPQTNLAAPANNWWKTELIDITQFISNSNNAQFFQIRFYCNRLFVGTPFSLAWYIDDISVSVKGENLSVADSKNLDYNIYPNPVATHFIIENSENITSVEIFQMDGKLVKNVLVNRSSIDIADLHSGIYIVKLTDINNQTVVKKIVKK
jgi:hypothetical protein